MARILSLRQIITLLLSVLVPTSLVTPAVVFPFNPQVPTVARARQRYNFQLSATTFAPGDADFTDSLSGQPAWLSLDSTALTFTGVPGQADVGSSSFVLTAADNTGQASVQCTIVTSSNLFLQLVHDLGQQLAAQANLSSTDPPVNTLLPGDTFNFHFQPDSFIDVVQRTLYYYATLADHTPLPAWLRLDPSTLAFAGTAPQLSAFPLSFEITLIASDVEGFAGSYASFTIVIGTRQLAFVPEEQNKHFEPGSRVNIADLEDMLYLNGQKVDASALENANASSVRSWQSFDIETLSFMGHAPDDATSANVSVSISDTLGDVAVLTLHFIANATKDTLFAGAIGTLNATSGQPFEYTIPTSILREPDASLNVIYACFCDMAAV